MRQLKEKTKGIESSESLLDWIPKITPRFERPSHLTLAAPYLDAILRGEEVRFLLSAPPRHAKSQTACFHLAARYLALYPHRNIAYCAYAAKMAESRSKEIRDIAVRAGIELRADTRSAGEWRTRQGGGLYARGVEGALTGFGVDLLIVDDPFRDRGEAESPTIRNNVMDWFTSTAYTRLEPGASALITHTRWHVDDIIGRIHDTDPGWTYLNLPAIDATGKALWPERWPVDALLKRRQTVGEYDWASLFQGHPRPRGSGVFNGVEFYEELPKKFKRVAVGIDLAYTEKTYSDWSVAVVMGIDDKGVSYVLDVVRRQCSAPEFILTLKGLLAMHNWPPVFTYIGGTEKGIIDFFATQGVKVHAEQAKVDKFVRAQPAAAQWNAKRILLPRAERPWVGPLVSEMASFTGVGDRRDDQVDALAAAYAKLAIPAPARGIGQNPIMPF